MWFSLFAIILILAITFYQGLQGLFTGVITCILTLLSAALAFGLFEDVYFGFLVDRQPDYGRPVALMAIFLISLLVLRGVADSLIKGNMHFPMYVDRAGGGVFGLVTALVTIGTLSIGIQMLPFGDSFLGFSRYTLLDRETLQPLQGDQKPAELDWSQVAQRRNNLWLSPDAVTVGLVSHLSDNALQGRNRLSDHYPDLLAAIHRPRANPLGVSRLTAPTNALRVTGYWDLEPREFYVAEEIERDNKKMVQLRPDIEALDPELNRIALRVSLDSEARDEDNYHRFVPEQFRLMVPEVRTGGLREFFPVGLSDEEYPQRLVKIHPGQGISRPTDKANELDLVFEVPDDLTFPPGTFIEYKQNARVAITAAHDKNEERPRTAAVPSAPGTPPGPGRPPPREIQPPPQPHTPPPPGPVPGPQAAPRPREMPRGQDRVSGIGPARADSVFSEYLPFTLTSYTRTGLEALGGEIRGGRLRAELDNDWQPPAGSDPPLDRLQVPEGMRLLQLSVEKLQPGSWIGNIYGGIIDQMADFYLVDSRGQNHMPVGSYAMARVGGRTETFELVYLDETSRGFARLPRFERIRPADLQGEYVLYFLFHLPPGAQPQRFHTGRQDVDLTGLDLVAPP